MPETALEFELRRLAEYLRKPKFGDYPYYIQSFVRIHGLYQEEMTRIEAQFEEIGQLRVQLAQLRASNAGYKSGMQCVPTYYSAKVILDTMKTLEYQAKTVRATAIRLRRILNAALGSRD